MKKAGIPEYVRNGALVDAKDAESLPDAAFADTVNRRFPLTDRANTWASAGYFAKTASDCGYSEAAMGDVMARIERAAKLYGIFDDVRNMMEKASGSVQEKTAAHEEPDPSCYCDPLHNGYPVFDKEGAELANAFFTEHAYKYGHERRMAIAKNIMKKCAQYGVEPSEQVRLSSGKGFPDREALAENMLFRANTLMEMGRVKMASELCKFAREVCVCPDEELDTNREGLFHALSGIDETMGIDDLYGERFFSPEELIFDITPESVKEVIDDAVPIGSETLSAKALSGLPRGLFEMVMPKEKVDGMIEDGRISPKKLSVTIVSMKSPESSHLLRAIRDFTDGSLDIPDDEELDAMSGSNGSEKDDDDDNENGATVEKETVDGREVSVKREGNGVEIEIGSGKKDDKEEKEDKGEKE